jgi:hypothetical protein
MGNKEMKQPAQHNTTQHNTTQHNTISSSTSPHGVTHLLANHYTTFQISLVIIKMATLQADQLTKGRFVKKSPGLFTVCRSRAEIKPV